MFACVKEYNKNEELLDGFIDNVFTANWDSEEKHIRMPLHFGGNNESSKAWQSC